MKDAQERKLILHKIPLERNTISRDAEKQVFENIKQRLFSRTSSRVREIAGFLKNM